MTRRLLLSYLAITIVVLALLEIPLGVFYAQREEERFIAAVERDAVVLASFYEDVLHLGEAPDPQFALDYADRTGARVVVVDERGISVLDTATSTARDFSTRPEITTALGGMRSAGIRHSETLETDLVYVAVPVASGGVVHGAVRSTIDANAVGERVQRFWFGLGAVAVVVIAAVVAAGWAIAQTVTRPVRRLQDSALRFAGGDLQPAGVDPSAPPELRSLAESMNTMASRLEQLLREQRAFVSDASHQLRTPLTAMRLRLENLQAEVDDPGLAGEVDAAIDETVRLSELVNTLLQLARVEADRPATVVDAVAIAAERVETWAALAAESSVSLELEAPAATHLTFVPGGLEQVLDNLIDNAIAASPSGSVVTIGLRSDERMAEISVIDHGRGLPDDQKGRATERFWRGTQDRTGTGLGLAIVVALVETGGGSLQLVDTPGGGLTVLVTLPSAGSVVPRPGAGHVAGSTARSSERAGISP